MESRKWKLLGGLAGLALGAAVVWLLGLGTADRPSNEESPTIATLSREADTTAPRSGSLPRPEAPTPEPFRLEGLTPPPAAAALECNQVERMAVSAAGMVWGVTQCGVIRWDPATGEPAFLTAADGLPRDEILGIVAGEDGNVWLAGLDRLARWNGSWRVTRAPAEGWMPGAPMAVDETGSLWAFLDGNSLGRFDGERWELFETPDLGAHLNPWALSVDVAADGTIWVTSTAEDHRGLYAFDGVTWQHVPLPHDNPNLGGSLAVTGAGEVWVGSSGFWWGREPGGGVARFADGVWTTFGAHDGLPTEGAFLVAGPDETLWAVSGEGLAFFDGAEWVPHHDVKGFQPGGSTDADGTLWAPAGELEVAITGFDGIEVRRLAMTITEAASAGGPPIEADGDDPRLPLGTRTGLPDNDWFDFLAGLCSTDGCHRDGHLIAAENHDTGYGQWAAGVPFHIRHGFVNEADEPLGNDYDLVVYVTRRDGPYLASGDYPIGTTYRFTTDYVSRGTTIKCGPGYWEQTEPHTCEWFVHDFPDGLPPGRFDIWVEWYAPCSAWLGLELTTDCADPTEVLSLFSSSVNMPFHGVDFGEGGSPPFDPYTEAEPITRGPTG